MKRAGAFTDEVKETIRKRAKDRCEMCGTRAEGVQFHHRQARQMGGTSDASAGFASNGLLLHPRCHERVESNRFSSYLMGWLVTKADTPADVPVRLWDGWFLLNDDGSITPTSGSDQ